MSTALERFESEYGGQFNGPVSQQEFDRLVDGIHSAIACMIASAIDAGSERDAVMEDEELEAAIKRLVSEWVEVN